jgi:hypothetical protein
MRKDTDKRAGKSRATYEVLEEVVRILQPKTSQ